MLNLNSVLGRELVRDEDGMLYTNYNGYNLYVIENDNPYGIRMVAACDEDIIITEELTKLPVVAMEALVAYAEGHIINGDTKEDSMSYEEYRYQRHIASVKGKVPAMEKKADDNAVYTLGKDGAVIGMRIAYEYTKENYPNANTEEIERRIKRIEKTPKLVWTIKKWWNKR